VVRPVVTAPHFSDFFQPPGCAARFLFCRVGGRNLFKRMSRCR
jgi:hypothetical protein